MTTKRSEEAARLIRKLEEIGKSNHAVVKQLRQFLISENRKNQEKQGQKLIVDAQEFLEKHKNSN